MPGKKPDYRVCVAEESSGSDNFYTDVGAGWSFSSDKAEGVSIKLKSGIAISGDVVLFRTKD